MHLHFIRHVPYEGLGHIRPWAGARGLRISETRPYEDQPFPSPGGLGMLVVLGGPMGACDEDRHPWLAREKRFLEAAIRAETPILAICLGAQMVANVLGAEVRRHVHPEIGWHTVQSTGATADGVLEPFFEPGAEVLQWHYDTFELPDGAEHLARSEGCEAQAFAWGERLVALQFHPEMTRQEVATVIERDGPVPDGPWVSDPPTMLAPERFERLAVRTHRFLDRLTAGWFGESPAAV